MNPRQNLRWLDYVKYWLMLTAASFAVGCPFILFLHSFGGHWLALLALSFTLASYFTLLVWQINKKQKMGPNP